MNLSVFLGAFLLSLTVHAQVLLQTAQEQFFDPQTAPRVGIEVELANLTVQKTAEILQSVLGGKITDHIVHEHYTDPQTNEEVRYTVTEKILVASRIGDIKVKPEDNGVSNENLKESVARTPLVEIVTSPIYVDSIPALQEAIDVLRDKGALGTADGFAVAIQVNVEIGQGLRQNMRVQDLLTLLRNYLHPQNHQDIRAEIQVSPLRTKYLGDYSPEMMKRIMDTNYNPTWREFYFDFMYRQSLEILGYKNAWTLSDLQAKKLLQQELEVKGFEAILRVVKWNNLRVSSLFMFLFPNDWLTKYLINTTWFHKYPIVEFREPNSDFKVKDRVEQVVGFIQQGQIQGEIRLPSDQEQVRSYAALMCRDLFRR